MASSLRAGDPATWLWVLWELIDAVDFEEIEYWNDELENDVKTAMAWIAEELGVEE